MSEFITDRPDLSVERFAVLEQDVTVELVRWPGMADTWQVMPGGLGSFPWRAEPLLIAASDPTELVAMAKQVCRILRAYRGAVSEAEHRVLAEIGNFRSMYGPPTADAASTPVAAQSPA